jgi:hypothetical protein
VIRVAIALAALLTLPAASAFAVDKYPEPSPYPTSWQFKFEHGTPKRVVVDVPGTSHPMAYWYLTYTVTNPGDKPQEFVPQFDMLSEDGKVVHSDRAIPPEVFHQIKVREGIKLLINFHQIEGPLNPGDDEAKDGVAIWPEPMVRMGTFSIFAGGLSGEFTEIKDVDGKPVINKDPNTGLETRMVVRKTLQLTYHVIGDQVRPGPDEDHPKSDEWIMR